MTRIPAKKYLGQNFLVDRRVIQRILAACRLQGDETILEIGPGQGALTSELASRAGQIFAVEKDHRMVALLQEKFASHHHLHLIEQDIIQFDISVLPQETKVIGNLPYNISTPIIEKFLTEPHPCREFFFTVQREFGERLAAQPGTKDYGALSCFVQFYADVEILFTIPPSCFRPVPKVTSCFVRLVFHGPLDPSIDPDRLFPLIRTAFQQRRKKIRNALAPVLGDRLAEILKKFGIDENLRPENLPLQDYIGIAKEMGFLRKDFEK